MEYYIDCVDGIAFMSLTANYEILISGSLLNAMYWNMPSNHILNAHDYNLIIIGKDLQQNNTNIQDCELKVDVVSNNSICVRLYEKDHLHDEENETVGFKITQGELFKIAKKYLQKN